MIIGVPEVTMVMRDRPSPLVDLGDGQALDIVAAAGEQPDDARQHARLVVDQHRDRMAFGVRHHALSRNAPLHPLGDSQTSA